MWQSSSSCAASEREAWAGPPRTPCSGRSLAPGRSGCDEPMAPLCSSGPEWPIAGWGSPCRAARSPSTGSTGICCRSERSSSHVCAADASFYKARMTLRIVQRHAAEPTARVEADVCVLGSGMAGVSAALVAARLGRRVVIVDAAPALGGQAVGSASSAPASRWAQPPPTRSTSPARAPCTRSTTPSCSTASRTTSIASIEPAQ